MGIVGNECMEKMTNTSINSLRIIKGFWLLVLVALLGLAKTYLIAQIAGICIGISLLIILTVFDWKNRDYSTNYTRLEYFLSMALTNAILYWYITHEIFIMWTLSYIGLGIATISVYIREKTNVEE